jgi:hypothetical protein
MMLTLMTAALAAAQPAPAANPHAHHAQHAQMPAHRQAAPSPHQQHEGMKDCCKDCCKGMGNHDDHADAKPHRGE